MPNETMQFNIPEKLNNLENQLLDREISLEDFDKAFDEYNKTLTHDESQFENFGIQSVESNLKSIENNNPEYPEQANAILNNYSTQAQNLLASFLSKAAKISTMGMLAGAPIFAAAQSENQLDNSTRLNELKHPLEVNSENDAIVRIPANDRIESVTGFEDRFDTNKLTIDNIGDWMINNFKDPSYAQKLAIEDQAKFAEYETAKNKYDAVRSDMVKEIDDPMYQARLNTELKQSGLLGAETYVVEKEKQNLADDYIIVPGSAAMPEKNVLAYAVPVLDESKYDSATVTDFHDLLEKNKVKEGQTVLPVNDQYDATMSVHEFTHEKTNTSELVTPYAARMYQESLNESGIKNIADSWIAQGKTFGMSESELHEYVYEQFAKPTEIDARKEEFKRVAEQLGFWRKDGPMTPEIVSNVEREIRNNPDLSEGVDQFLKIVRHDRIPEIINTLR